MTRYFRDLVVMMHAAALAACSPADQDEETEVAQCDWVETAVSLDFKPGDRPELTHSPGTLLDVLELEQQGELDWLGGGDWVDLAPSEGTTLVTTQVHYEAGRVAFVRALDETGNDALTGALAWDCPARYEIEAYFLIRTDDGALNLEFPVTLESMIGGSLTESRFLSPLAMNDSLQIVENESPPSPVEDPQLNLRLTYNTRFPQTEFTGRAGGTLTYSGLLDVSSDGEVTNVTGVSRQLLSWRSVPTGSGIPLAPR